MAESGSVIARRVARRAVRALMAMRESLQSGDDSGLASIWEEVCVQVQGQQSALWGVYDETAYAIVNAELEKLPLRTVRDVWLETPAGEWWLSEPGHEDGADPTPYDADDVVLYVLRLVYGMAADWDNARLRAYWARNGV